MPPSGEGGRTVVAIRVFCGAIKRPLHSVETPIFIGRLRRGEGAAREEEAWRGGIIVTDVSAERGRSMERVGENTNGDDVYGS